MFPVLQLTIIVFFKFLMNFSLIITQRINMLVEVSCVFVSVIVVDENFEILKSVLENVNSVIFPLILLMEKLANLHFQKQISIFQNFHPRQ